MNLRAIAEALEPLWRKPRPAEGPATHDYTARLPGHDYTIGTVRDGGLELRAQGWGCGIARSDFLILPNKGDTTRYRVKEIEYYRDPADMWAATLTFAPRQSGEAL